MATAFSRTLRSLDADGFRRWWLGLLPLGLLLLVWALWFVVAPVRVFAVSQDARIEAENRTHRMEAPAAGRLIAVHAELGQEVDEGDLLFELDSETQQLLLVEQRAQREALLAQAAGLIDEIDASQKALEAATAAGRVSGAVDAEKMTESETAARLAEAEAERTEGLAAGGSVAAAESERAVAEAEQARSSARAAQLERHRRSLALETELQDRQTALDGLRRELARVQGMAAALEAAVSRLEFEVEQRKIRAPVRGRVADLPQLQVGAWIGEGEVLGAVVPSGGLTAVAEFLPADALGHVRKGQPARVRLDGFPWTEFGTLDAQVVRVAEEPREGMIRVELSLDAGSNDRIPLQHGLPGVIEIEVARVSPATLVLRTAGAWFTGRETAT